MWTQLVNNLESRRENFTSLAHHWEEFDKKINLVESQLVRIEERAKHVDPLVRSRRHLDDTKNVIQVSV